MGGVIKAGSPAPTQSANQFQFDDMGKTYLAKVREEAAKIIADARSEADKIRKQAADEGLKSSQQATQAAVQKKVEEQLKALRPVLDQTVEKFTQSRQQWQKHWEQHSLKVALAVAGRLVRGELAREPKVTLTWIREALELAAGSERISLHLNPADHAVLAPQAESLLAQLGKLAVTTLSADPAVERGGCRVETEFGVIDQQLESQLKRLDEELL